MEHLFFYYGACLSGLVCLVSMLAVYISNRRVLKDLKNPQETKNKWLEGFVKEHQKLLKENTEIHNPAVYVIRRMRGRKIGPWNIRQVKGISWGAFFLSFLFSGIQMTLLVKDKVEVLRLPIFGEKEAMTLSFVTGAGILICLLAVRMLTGSGYQEEVMETNLLDYVENRWKDPVKIIPMETIRTAAGRENTKGKKKERESAPEEMTREKEQLARQIEQGILETAASDSRYSHLLRKEEKAIIKDVIKEFLT